VITAGKKRHIRWNHTTALDGQKNVIYAAKPSIMDKFTLNEEII